MLEELGLPYETVQLLGSDFKTTPGFLDKNPSARVPALRDGDIGVFGFAGIAAYLVDRYDPSASLSYPRGTPEYYTMQCWFLAQAGRSKARSIIRKSPGGLSVTYNDAERRIMDLETRLSQMEWVAGDRYTVADIANYGWARSTLTLRKADLAPFPAFKGWVERIEGRKAVQNAMDTQIRLMDEWKEWKEGKGERESAAPE